MCCSPFCIEERVFILVGCQPPACQPYASCICFIMSKFEHVLGMAPGIELRDRCTGGGGGAGDRAGVGDLGDSLYS